MQKAKGMELGAGNEGAKDRKGEREKGRWGKGANERCDERAKGGRSDRGIEGHRDEGEKG